MSAAPINADPTSLPRSFRGYDPQATEELFRRVAWEYGLLAGEHRELKQAVEEGQISPGVRRSGLAPARVTGDLDEVARSLLAAAHTAARAMRDSARDESERALKKARARASEIEHEATRAAAGTLAVREAASVLRATLRDALEKLERGEQRSPAAHVSRSPKEDGAPAPTGGAGGVVGSHDFVRG